MRMRRHTQPAFASVRSTPWRRLAGDIGLVLLTFVVGYAISAYWLTPGSPMGDDHAIPRVLGLPMPDARTALATAGFRSRIEGERTSGTVPRGSILWQDPPPGMVLGPNAIVQLVLSAGPAPVTVPDVIGLSLPYAEKVVAAAGITVGQVDTVRGSGPETGVVLATRPAPGTGRPRGAPVDLVVSGTGGGGR